MQQTATPAQIPDAEFKKHQRKSFEYLSQTKSANLIGIVSGLNSDIIPQNVKFMESGTFNSLWSFIDASATYSLVHEKLSEVIQDHNKQSVVKPTASQELAQKKLINAYSVFIASEIGLSELEKIGNIEKNASFSLVNEWRKAEFSFEKLGDDMFNQMIVSYANTLMAQRNNGNIINGSDVALITKGFFQTMREKSLFEKSDGVYQEFMKILESQPLSIQGKNFKGFDLVSGGIKKIDPENLPKLEDVIGNEELLEAGKALVRKVVSYDFKAKKNSKDPFKKILYVPGDSGVGKTFSAEALQRYFIELCEANGKPYNVFTLSPDMFKTSYMNESANKLLGIFREQVYNPNTINFMYVPDFDTIIASRKDAESSNRPEDKQLMGAWLSMLSGSNVPKEGRFIIIFDTNYQVDDVALLGRLGSPVIAKGPQKADEFVRLLKKEMRDGFRKEKDYIKLSDADWKDVGEACAKYKVEVNLSGRDVKNIGEALCGAADKTAIPDEFLSMSYDDQIAYMKKNQSYAPIQKADLMRELDSYVQNRKAAVDREAAEEKKKMQKQWKLVFDAKKEFEPTKVSLFLELAREILPESTYQGVERYVSAISAIPASETK